MTGKIITINCVTLIFVYLSLEDLMSGGTDLPAFVSDLGREFKPFQHLHIFFKNRSHVA